MGDPWVHTELLTPPFTTERLRNFTEEFIRNEEDKYVNSVVNIVRRWILLKAYADSPNALYPTVLAPEKGNLGKH